MKRRAVMLAVILIQFAGLTPSFGQTVSDEARRHFERGVAAADMAKEPADYEAAIGEFEQAARLAPDWPDVFYNLGLVQEAVEKYAEAIKSLRQFLQLAPNDANAEDAKGRIYRMEFKVEQILTIPDIVNILASCGSEEWQGFLREKSGALTPADWRLDFTRVDDHTVRVETDLYRTMEGEKFVKKFAYGNVSIDGPVLRYTVRQWGTRAGSREYEYSGDLNYEIEVVSRTHIKQHMYEFIAGSRYDSYSEFRKK